MALDQSRRFILRTVRALFAHVIRALVLIAVVAGAGGVLAGASAAATPASPIRDSDGFTETFRSAPWLHPPIVSVSGRDPDRGLGDIFADPENSAQPGPLIFSPDGRLIYFQPLHQSAAFNVQVQRYQGQTVLTYWQGYVEEGVGIGRDLIFDHHYQLVAAVYAGHGYHADLHDFSITPQGNALITAYAPVKADLSSVGGSRNGTLLDSIVQEIDIATGQVLWEWHAHDHVPLSDSYAGKPGRLPYDFFHVNSVQLLPNGNLLISSRHTWALYVIDMRTGRILLTIGGKRSSFKMGSGAQFEWQHNAHMQPDGTITAFDNGTNGQSFPEHQSRALRIRLNLKTHRATLVRVYTDNPSLLSSSQGDVQVLPDGNTFVGWGGEPYFSEFGRRGRQLFTLHFNSPLQSYRGYRFPWWGQPLTPPSVAAAASGSRTTVYASWNGATDVAAWRVLAGASSAALAPVGQFPNTVFETAMNVPSTAAYFAVQALGAAGQVLGTSATTPR